MACSRSIAARAAPELSENPNLVSSWPVRTNSCVCASTPGVTRTMQCSVFSDVTIFSSRSISSKLSTTRRCTPSLYARRSSVSDLLLPCTMTRWAGTPDRSTMSISPSVATSMYKPSSAASRAIAPHKNDFEAKATPSLKICAASWQRARRVASS